MQRYYIILRNILKNYKKHLRNIFPSHSRGRDYRKDATKKNCSHKHQYPSEYRKKNRVKNIQKKDRIFIDNRNIMIIFA